MFAKVCAMTLTTAAVVAGLALAGQCNSETPTSTCPRAGVVHEMLGTVGGKTLRFTGWHDAAGTRRYLPGDNPEFDAALSAAGIGVGAAQPAAVSPGAPKVVPAAVGPVANYGVNLRGVSPAQQALIRTNDPLVGSALNSVLAQPSPDRPCPGPEPCPNPTPPLPDLIPPPAPPSHSWLVIGVGVVLTVVAFLVLVVALVFAFIPRKAAP